MTQERLSQIETKLKTLELDLEPEGRISEGFEYLASDLDSFRHETRKTELPPLTKVKRYAVSELQPLTRGHLLGTNQRNTC